MPNAMEDIPIDKEAKTAAHEIKQNTYALVKDKHVGLSLRAAESEEAELKSWTLKDFTQKGDNYASFVTSIKVDFESNGRHHCRSFVAKMNPCRTITALDRMMKEHFLREELFLTKVAPAFSQCLRNIGHEPLRIPRCFSSDLTDGKELLVLEDIRCSGFLMKDRRKGLDLPHALLVLKELARLHASSILHEAHPGTRPLSENFPVINEKWMNGSPHRDVFGSVFCGQLEDAALLADEEGERFRPVSKWIREMKKNVTDILADQLTDDDKRFCVLIHNDCWTNNLLFRYDQHNNPCEVMLLDHQMIRKASLAIDIIYFIYTSLEPHIRRTHLEELLSTYHQSFCSVLQAANRCNLSFSLEELKVECRSKVVFGCLLSFIILPAALSEYEDLVDPDSLTVEEMDAYKDSQRQSLLRIFGKSKKLKERFVAAFEDLLEIMKTSKI